MIKKALVTLLSSAILATTVVSGVVATPTVAYAEETKVIKITRDDCIAMDEIGYDLEAVFGEYGGIIKACDADVYFLEFGRVDGDLLLYQLPSIASGSSVVIDTGRCKYTIDSSYTITDVLSAEQEEKDNERAKVNKWISDMVICKHPSAGNVTLSASEKKGTLTVNKADIKTATKLDMMLKSKKAVTVKIKASSKSKAVNQFKSLRKLTGHANTYGVVPWIEADEGIPFTEKIDSDRFKKSGSFYTVNISKSISQNYTYLCKAYKRAFELSAEVAREERLDSGEPVYDFVAGTHLCDCSSVVRLQAISKVILRVHTHRWDNNNGDAGDTSLDYRDNFKALAGEKKYGAYVCEGLARLSQMVGWASGFKSEYISSARLNHGWARFCKVKDSSGKSFTVSLDNAWLNLDGKGSGSSVIAKSTWKKSTDVYAINQILCVTGMQWG